MTVGDRTIAAAAGGILITGLAITAHFSVNQAPARAIGGTTLVILGVTTLVMVALRQWIAQAGEERRHYLAASAAATEERMRLQQEREQLRIEAAAARTLAEQDLAARRDALRIHFENRRAALITESFEAGARMALDGHLDTPPPGARSSVIPFPEPAPPHAQAARTQVRERGGAHP